MNQEAQIEKNLIAILGKGQNQWDYRPELKTEADLWHNLRNHINRVNLGKLEANQLTDREFNRLKSKLLKETNTPFFGI